MKNVLNTKISNTIIALTLTILWFTIIPNISSLVWPKKIENEFIFQILCGIINHTGALILCNSIVSILYLLEHPQIEKYKCNDEKWPWQEDKDKWYSLIKKSLLLVGFNNFIIAPILLFLSAMRGNRNLSYESLPSTFEFFWQTCFCILVEDFFFYWSHRFLHIKTLYPYFHKIHHTHKVTISIAAEYAHPVEFILGNVLPTNAGPMLLGKKMHLFTVYAWILLRILKTTEAHSGYSFPWSPTNIIPMSTEPSYHNFHHLKFNGNYASFL